MAFPKPEWEYSLHVSQGPERARMCGFGDKDRRPITPPPCVRLDITDKSTGRLVPNSVIQALDVSLFVLIADLFSADGKSDINLVVHPSAYSPAGIIASSTLSQSGYDGRASPQTQQPKETANKNELISNIPSGALTRNLVGTIVTSAFKLYDVRDTLGIYFVFQDLSVRTEGTFRLKFSLTYLGKIINAADPSIPSHVTLNTSEPSAVPTSVFSDPFAVFSAKRFPGVVECTALSKKFAAQGLKIPIRKDSGSAASSTRQRNTNPQHDTPDLDHHSPQSPYAGSA